MASDIKELNKYMKIISLFVLLCNLLWWGWSLCRKIAETVRYSDQMFPYDHGRYYIEAFHSGLRSPLFCEAWSVSGGLIICGGEERTGLTISPRYQPDEEQVWHIRASPPPAMWGPWDKLWRQDRYLVWHRGMMSSCEAQFILIPGLL